MVWFNRILFTLAYLIIGFYMLYCTPISPMIILLLVVIFSDVISKRGILAGLEKYLKKEKTDS